MTEVKAPAQINILWTAYAALLELPSGAFQLLMADVDGHDMAFEAFGLALSLNNPGAEAAFRAQEKGTPWGDFVESLRETDHRRNRSFCFYPGYTLHWRFRTVKV